MKLIVFSSWDKDRRNVKLSDWETDEKFFLKEFSKIKKGWTVVDVGSEYGYYAIRAAQLVGDEGRVLAIEAHPETYQLVKKNVELYGLDEHIIPIWKAVGDKTGEVRFYEKLSPGGTSILPRRGSSWDRNRIRLFFESFRNGSIFKLISNRWQRTVIFKQITYRLTSKGRARAKRTVPLDTLDRIVKEHNIRKIDLVKIDVEGAELAVIKGSLSILKRDKPILLIEVHHGYGWKPETLYGFLQKLGYSLNMEERYDKTFVVAHYECGKNTNARA